MSINCNAQYIPIPFGTGGNVPIVPFYVSALTIDHTKCGGSNNDSMAVLVSITDNRFKISGGHMKNNRWNIEFYSDSTDTTSLLNWQIEKYDSTTGQLIAWVEQPLVSHTINTIFFCRYGMSWISTNQSPGRPWKHTFKMVLHLENGSSLQMDDATGNGNNATNISAFATSGQIDGAAGLNNGGGVGGTYFTTNSIYNLINGSSQSSISFWYVSSGSEPYPLFFVSDSAPFDYFQIDQSAGLDFYTGQSGSLTTYHNLHSGAIPYLVTVEKTASGNHGNFYVDGILITPISGAASDYNSTASFTYWGTYIDQTSGVTGLLDEIEISDSALGQDWETTRYNMESSPSTFLSLGTEIP